MATTALLAPSVTNIPIALDSLTFIIMAVQKQLQAGTSWTLATIMATVTSQQAILPTNAG